MTYLQSWKYTSRIGILLGFWVSFLSDRHDATHKSLILIEQSPFRSVASLSGLIVQSNAQASQTTTSTTSVKIKPLSSCHLREFELCFIGSGGLFQRQDGIPLSESEIRSQCEIFDESINCFESYTEQCLNRRMHSFLSLFGHDLADLQRDFCDKNSELRKNYTILGPCMQSVQKKYQFNCVRDLEVALEPVNKRSPAVRMRLLCCGVNRFKSCILDRIDEECGEEASQFLMGILRRVSSNALGILCRHYEKAQICTRILPEPGTKPHIGRNTSALSRVVSGFTNWRFMLTP